MRPALTAEQPFRNQPVDFGLGLNPVLQRIARGEAAPLGAALVFVAGFAPGAGLALATLVTADVTARLAGAVFVTLFVVAMVFSS